MEICCYQELLLLEPEYSVDPYAYQYEKIVKQIEDIIVYWDEYYYIYAHLGDDRSKEIFMKMILFRLTYDYRMNLENKTSYSHYFDRDVLILSQDEVFVDCGGYLGDTLETFKKETKNQFKKYYLFEPDKKLIEEAKEKGDDRVVYINQGVWERETILYFKKQTADGNGTFVHTAQDDVIEVLVTSLDQNVDYATFIKMDVEGSELMALKGAKNLIEKCHPKLAVCVYHKYKDVRELYHYIIQLGKYKVYLRAEWDNVDTELYYLCIPVL